MKIIVIYGDTIVIRSDTIVIRLYCQVQIGCNKKSRIMQKISGGCR
jgi:hypothetical protein